MKNVILSADGDSMLYSVPDAVAENLETYCMDFCTQWLWHSPDAQKYRTGHGLCYHEGDFIDYLNTYLFPEEKSVLVRNLGWTQLGEQLPEEYRALPSFNF